MRTGIIKDLSRHLTRAALPLVDGMPQWPVLVAVQSALIISMPLMLLGSFAVLLNSFPVPAYKDFMEATFGPGWPMLGDFLWNGTFAVMSLVIAFCIGQYLAKQYNAANLVVQVSPLVTGLVGVVSLLCLIEAKDGMLSQRWTGVSGLFLALLVALCAGRLFLFLFSYKPLRLHLPGGSTDFAVLYSFNAMIPGMLTVFAAAMVGVLTHAALGISLHEAFYGVIRIPFEVAGEGLERALLYIFSLQSLWFLGIHGANALDPITHDLYGAVMAANVAAAGAGQALPHIVTKTFMDTFVFMGGSGATISLVGALFLAGETQANRRLAGLSVVPALFNINEVLLFGLPVILNPVMLVPFVLTPLLFAMTSYAAVASGLVPEARTAVEWTTPILLNGYLATGSAKGSLLQCVNIVIGIAAYAPFVRLGNELNTRRLKTAFRQLLGRSCVAGGPLGRGCTTHQDDAGSLARGLLADLEEACVLGKDLFLEFQPQISASSGRVEGVEALLRWKHPFHGLIPAPIIIALAEESFLIRPLGLLILDQACSVRKAWLDAGLESLTMSVNVSPLQLEENLPDTVKELLWRYGLPSKLLELEVTESSTLDAASAESHALTRLHAMGLRIAIDDFGMGHSSLKYLRQFPVSTVKIDGGISREVVSNPICADIVRAITRLCRARGMNCVAEFVETDMQAAVLRELGVDIFQGYMYSRPLVADACLQYIVNNYALGRR